MNRSRDLIVLLAALLFLGPIVAKAAYLGQDPNWPCEQRLVPTLSAAAFWAGPPIPDSADWRTEPKVSNLVDQISPRRVSAEEGSAAIAKFTSGLSPDERRKLIPLAFAGLLEEANSERDQVISRIKDLGERQRKLAALIAQLTSQLDGMPMPAARAPEDPARAELEQRLNFLTMTFNDGRGTMRYACEVPSELEARLGAYGRSLQQALP